MTRILFVCHGNICRSPMAEFVMKDMVRRAGLEDEFQIASAATSSEEIGSPVYPPARRKLREHGIRCDGKTARRIKAADYEDYDLLIGMDEANMRNMARCFGGDTEGKLHLLLGFAGREDSVADPWYTGDFEATWQDVNEGCLALLNRLYPEVRLDFSGCQSRSELYDLMAERMLWQEAMAGTWTRCTISSPACPITGAALSSGCRMLTRRFMATPGASWKCFMRRACRLR